MDAPQKHFQGGNVEIDGHELVIRLDTNNVTAHEQIVATTKGRLQIKLPDGRVVHLDINLFNPPSLKGNGKRKDRKRGYPHPEDYY